MYGNNFDFEYFAKVNLYQGPYGWPALALNGPSYGFNKIEDHIFFWEMVNGKVEFTVVNEPWFEKLVQSLLDEYDAQGGAK